MSDTTLIMLNPAHDIIAALGGNTAVGAICGVSRTSVWKWSQPREYGGTGGIIPSQHASKLIDAGKRAGVEIPLAAFIAGADEAVARNPMKRRRLRGSP